MYSNIWMKTPIEFRNWSRWKCFEVQVNIILKANSCIDGTTTLYMIIYLRIKIFTCGISGSNSCTCIHVLKEKVGNPHARWKSAKSRTSFPGPKSNIKKIINYNVALFSKHCLILMSWLFCWMMRTEDQLRLSWQPFLPYDLRVNCIMAT